MSTPRPTPAKVPPITRLAGYVATHRKAISAYLGVVLLAAEAVAGTVPWYAVLTALAAAVGVHAIPNKLDS